MKQRFVAKVFVILMAFVMLFSLCAFTINAATQNNVATQAKTQTTRKPKRPTYTETLQEVNKRLPPPDEGFWLNGVRELGEVKTYDALGATVITQIAKCFEDGEDADAAEVSFEIFKGVVNLFASCYGLGGISNALLDAVWNFGEQPQSEDEILRDYYNQQFEDVHKHMNEMQDDISELSKQVDALTQVIQDEFAADDAKDKVMEFMSSSGSDFNYRRFKNYLYGSSTDSYGNIYYTQAYYDQLVNAIMNNAPDEIIKANYDALYSSMASTSQHDANIILLYEEHLMYNEDSGEPSIQRYYYDYLSTNKTFLGNRNAEYEALKFALDVYTTALFADHCIAMCNNYQLMWMYETYGSNPSPYDEYDYGDGTITYSQLLLNADAIAGRQARLEKQMVADIAYILNLEGSAVIQNDDNSTRIMDATDQDAWGCVQVNQTIYLNKMADNWCDIFGFDTDAFSYEWYGEKEIDGVIQTELIEKNDGILCVDGKYSAFDGVVKYKEKEIYSISFKVADAPTFISGTGEPEDPYVICNAEQFMQIFTIKDGMSQHYTLVDDIDLSGVDFSPIGTKESPFTGSLNGNGYAIQNLTVTADTYVGLFGYIGDKGEVKNLNIENSEFNIKNDDAERAVYAGAIAAFNQGNIENCCVIDSSILISAKSYQDSKHIYDYAGGVVGYSEGNSEISYCKIDNTSITASLYHNYSTSDTKNSTNIYAAGIVASIAENTLVHSCYVGSGAMIRAKAWALASFNPRPSKLAPHITVHAAGVVARCDDIAKIKNVFSQADIRDCEYEYSNVSTSKWVDSECSAKSDPYIPEISEEQKNSIKTNSQESIVFPSQKLYDTIDYSFDGEFYETYNCYAGQLYYCNEKTLKTDDLNIQINGENVEYTVISYYNFDTFNSDKSATKMNTVLVTFSANYNDAEIVGKLDLPITIAENSPTGLEVAVKPEKTVYDRGEPVSLDGGSFILRYQDGTTIDVTSEINPPVCDTSEDGTKQVIVSYGDYTTTYDIVVACAHDYYDTLFVPTCYAYGYTLHTCRKCSHEYKSDATDKIAHATVAQNAIEATCTEPGHTSDFVCTMCQQIIVDGEEIPPVGHDFTDAVQDAGAHYCTICNAGEEHLFRTTENEEEVVCTCMICGFKQAYEHNDREAISKLSRVVVSDAYSLPGSNEVVVYIEIFSDIGVTGADFSVYFGTELEFVSCSKGNILNDAFLTSENFGDYINVSLSDAAAQYVGNDKEKPNTLLKLVFRTPEHSAAGDEYPITIVNRADINSKGQTVFVSKIKGESDGIKIKDDFISLNGKIRIVNRLPGDVVGDGTTDLLDAIIVARYSVLGTKREEFVEELKTQYENFDISYGDVYWEEDSRGIYDSDDVTQILRYIVGGYEARLLTKDFYVTLNFNDGTGNETKLPVVYDEQGNIILESLPIVKRIGYKFDGWYYGFGKDAAEMTDTYAWQENAYEQTLYAHYTLNSITFVGNGAEGFMGSVSYAKDITTPQMWTVDNQFKKTSNVYFDSNYYDIAGIPKSVTHSFIGWADSPDGEPIYKLGQTINLSEDEIGDMTLYAIWSTEYIEIPLFSRTGYYVSKWTSDKEGFYYAADANSNYAVTAGTTLYAVWELAQYTAVWNESDGYEVRVERIDNPYSKAPLGVLNNGATVYYGDQLQVTYTNAIGYSITETGNPTLTVTGNVDSSMIYVIGEYVPGLYDAAGAQLASWDDLVSTYGMDVTKDYVSYQCSTTTTHPDYILTNYETLVDGCVLVLGNVDNVGIFAFYDCRKLTTIVIPESVMHIGNYAFKDCTDLTSITIPDGVTSIGYEAFRGCTSLTSITLPFVGAEVAGTYNTEFAYIFGGYYYIPSSLKNVTITGGTSIEKDAFSNCENLTRITLPDSVTSIGKKAFNNCKSLTSISIPDSVTSIGDDAFRGCTNLTSAHITDMIAWCNIDFPSSDSNPLYYAHNLYLNGELVTDLVYPDNMTNIGQYTFYGCTSLTSLTIPDGITSIGAYAFYGCSGLTSITISNSVTSIDAHAFYGCQNLTSITIPDGVTSIGASAFSACTGLTSITIPDSVTSIGNSAFRGCTGLTSIPIPDSVTSIEPWTFASCTGLTSITIPDGITSIGAYAFTYCYNLTSITIPDSVTSIGVPAFGSCTSLTSIMVSGNHGNYQSIKGDLYSKDGTTLIQYAIGKTEANLVIPANVTSIGNDAFNNCQHLTNIVIPNSVTSIGDSAFIGCTGLTSITIPDSVTSIGSSAFMACKSLTSITIPDSVTSIGSSAFSACTGLTSITIPDSVTSIGSSAFSGCTGLTSITIPDSVTSIGFLAFEDCNALTAVYITDLVAWCTMNFSSRDANPLYYANNLYLSGQLVTEFVLPDGATSIGDYAFHGYSSLTNISIPDSVISIGSYAFYGCTGLTSITMPDGVTSIGDYAFSGCTNLTSVTIGDSVTSIGDYAFSGCTNLTSATIGDSVTSIGGSAFRNCTSLKSIIIPGSVTSIGGSAFSGCTGLTSMTVPFVGATKDGTEDTHFGHIFGAVNKFGNDDCVPTSLKTVTITGGSMIGERAFYDCTSLMSIIIPKSVTSIGDDAFRGCANLTSVHITDMIAWCNIDFLSSGSNPLYYAHNLYLNGKLVTDLVCPDSMTSIGRYAFYNCTSLTSVTIGDSVTSIGGSAFSGCTGLTSITIPDSVTSIGGSAFSGCTGLTSMTLPFVGATKDGTEDTHFGHIFGAVSEISNDDCVPTSLKTVIITGGSMIGEKAFYYCLDLASITISGSVTSIGESAFYSCTSLTSVTIGNSVTSIGDYAFSGCTNLTSIVIPDNVTSIGAVAFINCTNLTSVTIGDSVTSIGASAFRNCTSLTSITIPDSVTSIGDYAFEECAGLTDVYYTGTQAEWQAITKGRLWDYNTGSYTIHYNWTGEES